MLIGIKFSVTVCWYLVYSSASKKEKKFKKSSEEKAKKEISDKKADTQKDNK